MKVFYITYWGINEGLSVATVYPNLKILAATPEVTQIEYFTVERSSVNEEDLQYKPISKVRHHPITAYHFPIHVISKVLDWIKLLSVLYRATRRAKPDLIICRGAMPGILGYFLHQLFRIPYYVESFEPHAAYMLEGNTWSRTSVKYRFESYFEQQIKATATGLITVSQNYKFYLQEVEKISEEKIWCVPCYVDLLNFKYNPGQGSLMRKKLFSTDNYKVGIYVGKFGDIYYDEEAFEIFNTIYSYFQGNFNLIILSPEGKQYIENKLNAAKIPKNKYFVNQVSHQQVPNYLSAADFAISTIRPSESRKYCSPIKHGEYWANGLPILMPDGIGDDSDIIKREGGGAIFESLEKEAIYAALFEIESILSILSHRTDITQLAQKYRTINKQRKVYEKILKSNLFNQ